jgi:hypothetical protein
MGLAEKALTVMEFALYGLKVEADDAQGRASLQAFGLGLTRGGVRMGKYD